MKTIPETIAGHSLELFFRMLYSSLKYNFTKAPLLLDCWIDSFVKEFYQDQISHFILHFHSSCNVLYLLGWVSLDCFCSIYILELIQLYMDMEVTIFVQNNSSLGIRKKCSRSGVSWTG
jgi:hypothetical protein